MGLIRSILAAIRSQLSAGWGHLCSFGESLRHYSTWVDFASNAGRGIANTPMLPAMVSEFAINRTIDGWSALERRTPMTAAGIKMGGAGAWGLATLPFRLLSGGGGSASEVPSMPPAAKTPMKTMKSPEIAKKDVADIPINGAADLMPVIEFVRAKPEDRKTVKTDALSGFQRAVLMGKFTDGLDKDRIAQLADMKDHEILQLFKKTVSDEETRSAEMRKSARAAKGFKSGSLDAGDIADIGTRPGKVGAKKGATVVKMPPVSGTQGASVIGDKLMKQAAERYDRVTRDRADAFRAAPSGEPDTQMGMAFS